MLYVCIYIKADMFYMYVRPWLSYIICIPMSKVLYPIEKIGYICEKYRCVCTEDLNKQGSKCNRKIQLFNY